MILTGTIHNLRALKIILHLSWAVKKIKTQKCVIS